MDAKDFLLKKGYQLIKKIGQGSYAIVYKATRLSDRKVIAVKIISVAKLDKKQLENALTEVRIICAIKHPNIVQYHDAFIDQKNKDLYLIMEYLGGGDLSGRIGFLQRAKSLLSEKQVWRYSLQILQGLKALHQHKIIHRDIKPGNLFLSDDFQTVKVGDLNTSKIMGDKKLTNTVIGTPFYLAPEIWKNSQYDYRCDIFSLGCVVYEMAMLRPPFKSSSVEELYKLVKRGQYPPITSRYSKALKTFVGKCLQTNFKVRPNVKKLLESQDVRQQLKENSDLDFRKNHGRRNHLTWSHLKTPTNMQEVKAALDSFRNMSRGVSQKHKSRRGAKYLDQKGHPSHSFQSKNQVKKSWTGKISLQNSRMGQAKSVNRGKVKIYGNDKRTIKHRELRKSSLSQQKNRRSSFQKKPKTIEKKVGSRRSISKRTTSQMKKSQSEAMKEGYKNLYKKKVKSGVKAKHNTSVSLSKTKKKLHTSKSIPKTFGKTPSKASYRNKKPEHYKGVDIKFVRHHRKGSNLSKDFVNGKLMVNSGIVSGKQLPGSHKDSQSKLSSKLFRFDTESAKQVENDIRLKKKSLVPVARLSQNLRINQINYLKSDLEQRHRTNEINSHKGQAFDTNDELNSFANSYAPGSQPGQFRSNLAKNNFSNNKMTRRSQKTLNQQKKLLSKHSNSEARINPRFKLSDKAIRNSPNEYFGYARREENAQASHSQVANEERFMRAKEGDRRGDKLSKSPSYSKYRGINKNYSLNTFQTNVQKEQNRVRMNEKILSVDKKKPNSTIIEEEYQFGNSLQNQTGYLNSYLNKNLQKQA